MKKEWINVNEKLPEKSGNYLIYLRPLKNSFDKPYICTASYNEILRTFYPDKILYEKYAVANWSDLPEQPEHNHFCSTDSQICFYEPEQNSYVVQETNITNLQTYVKFCPICGEDLRCE